MARGKKKESPTPEERLQAALVPESEQPYKVPENWRWTRLEFLLQSSREKTDEFSDTDIKYVGLEHMQKNGGIVAYDSAKGIKSLKNVFHPQQILYGKLRPYLNKHDIATFDGICSTDILVFNATSVTIPKFVNFFLDQDTFIEYAVSNSKGINLPRVSESIVLDAKCPLPPLPEQQRIVDRIESLFAKLDEAKQKAQEALDSFETRKAAILHKAFTGELTAQWRKEHGVGMESWDRLQWGNFIVSIEAGKNWNAEGRPPRDDEFGVVKVSAVTWGEFNEAESKTCMVEEQWNENVQIHEGDFLFSRANTLQLVGNCVIVKFISRRLMLSDKILRLKFDKCVIPEYVLHFTRSDLYRNQIEQLASGNQDGMRNVSQKNMKLVEFPIPKLEEQKEIVRILNDLLTKEQQAKESAEGVLEQIDLIKKAILARAFRGELGTNDPTEESAVELLKALFEA